MVLASLGGGLSLDQPSHHQTDGWGHEKKAVGVMNLMLVLMAEVWWQGHTFPQQSDDHERGKVKDLLLWWWVIMVSLLMVTALPSWLPGHSSGERLGFVVRGCAVPLSVDRGGHWCLVGRSRVQRIEGFSDEWGRKEVQWTSKVVAHKIFFSPSNRWCLCWCGCQLLIIQRISERLGRR